MRRNDRAAYAPRKVVMTDNETMAVNERTLLESCELVDRLSAERAEFKQEPVTLKDCQRVLAYIKDSRIVDKATHVRCYEFLLSVFPDAGDINADANRYQAMVAVLRGYTWLATSRGPHAYDEHDAYEADVRALMTALLEILPPYRAEPFQSVLRDRDRIRTELRHLSAQLNGTIDQLAYVSQMKMVAEAEVQRLKAQPDRRSGTNRRQGKPAPEGKAIVARASGDRRIKP